MRRESTRSASGDRTRRPLASCKVSCCRCVNGSVCVCLVPHLPPHGICYHVDHLAEEPRGRRGAGAGVEYADK